MDCKDSTATCTKDPDELISQFDNWGVLVEESMLHYGRLKEKDRKTTKTYSDLENEINQGKLSKQNVMQSTELLSISVKKATTDQMQLLKVNETLTDTQRQVAEAKKRIIELEKQLQDGEKKAKETLEQIRKKHSEQMEEMKGNFRRKSLEQKQELENLELTNDFLMSECKDNHEAEKTKMNRAFEAELTRQKTELDQQKKAELEGETAELLKKIELKNKNEEWMHYKWEQLKTASEKDKSVLLRQIEHLQAKLDPAEKNKKFKLDDDRKPDRHVTWNERIQTKGILKTDSVAPHSLPTVGQVPPGTASLSNPWKSDHNKSRATVRPISPLETTNDELPDVIVANDAESRRSVTSMGQSGPMRPLDTLRRPKATKARAETPAIP